ncbi:MAG: ATP-dependent DNA helicase RecG [Synergistaceae bacterium]|nr:ATP-dependent DNA helicase RecG [Synergistaceae bacterium]
MGRMKVFAALGLHTISDMLFYMPLRYEDRRRTAPIGDLVPGVKVTVKGTVSSFHVRKSASRNLFVATLDVEDESSSASVVLFGGYRSFYSIRDGAGIIMYGMPLQKGGVLEFQNPDYVILRHGAEEAPPDFGRILPVYPTTKGLPRRVLANLIFSCVTSPNLSIDDPIPADMLKKRSLSGLRDALRGVHAPSDQDEINNSRVRLAYGELFEMQRKIFLAREARDRIVAKPIQQDAVSAGRFTSSLPFELTASQLQAMDEICRDMAVRRPMHRLLQGDVGSGKTVVALAAASACACAGFQSAILAPTTILSSQFYGEAVKYLSPLGFKCAELTGGTGAKDRGGLLDGLAGGEIDVLVGTHAMLEDDVSFKSLGLVVIDEQHRFGVAQRDMIYGKSVGAHVLLMSATPIPRTLCMALYGDIDSSAIRGKPSSRKPVVTRVLSDNHMDELYKFISSRVKLRERCYWVCPLIGEDDGDSVGDSSVMARTADMEKKIPGVSVAKLYGSMTPAEKVSVMERFSSGDAGILVSTTVIEVGVDVRDACVIVVESASSFGLSQLHQLRGRVGRGSRAGFCILLDSAANISGNRRLEVLTKCDDGYVIAEEDLRLRGAGEIAGVRQHGAVSLKIASLPEDLNLLEMAREDAAIK